jgi:hypothetical protein
VPGWVLALAGTFCELLPSSIRPAQHSTDRNEGNDINKKIYWIIAGVSLFLVLGDHLLEWVGEALFLSLETLEMSVDTLYEDVFHLDAEASQQATAWTGFVVFVALLIWLGLKLRRQYLRLRELAPDWWAEQKSEFKAWWQTLPPRMKLAHFLGGLTVLTLLSLSLFV